ncbi:hypothetical protein ACIO93_02795 [Streptomyces sp. NPDC087903]|uniref:hypothetical protein n=1 Tax=Streptomyces sp. NPDC087903 TaxID=3365819 RepID=UPI0038161F9E
MPVWLEEAAEHRSEAAQAPTTTWKQGELSPDAARELADRVTARVTHTGFNEDEGPTHDGPTRVTVADKEAVHRWLAAQGHDL